MIMGASMAKIEEASSQAIYIPLRVDTPAWQLPVPSRWSAGRRSPETPEKTARRSFLEAAAALPSPNASCYLEVLYEGRMSSLGQHFPLDSSSACSGLSPLTHQ